jgi:hypothetical protein
LNRITDIKGAHCLSRFQQHFAASAGDAESTRTALAINQADSISVRQIFAEELS